MEAIATLVENDPYLTSPIGDRVAARKARRAKFRQCCDDAPEPRESLPSEQEELPAEPVFSFGEWVDRQVRLNPLPKATWFSIFGEIEIGDPIQPKIEEIVRIVRTQYSFSKIEFLSDRRFGPLVRSRQIAMYLAKKLTGRSLPEIGRRLGNRDHTTVLHAVRKIEHLLKTDLDLSAEVEALKIKITGAPA